MGLISELPDWLNFIKEYGLGGLLTIVIVSVVYLIYKRDLFDEINLWLTGSDVMRGRAFAHFLARRLKKHKGDVIFYNIPLATLDSEKDRKVLWKECLNRNPDLNLRLLLSPDQANHLLRVWKNNEKVADVLDVMGDRLGIVVVEFPVQEKANYGCVMLHKKGGDPLLVTASFTLRGFWNWDGNVLNCFLAFSPRRFQFAPYQVTSEMCESISSLAKEIITAAQLGTKTWDFRYGPNNSDVVKSNILTGLVRISELDRCINGISEEAKA